ncbi:MAG TPA: M23 family metallopeptidase [Candidatus Kapabacteria bacterium]|nr:M23 family metallopeptidase [Candidatus Kapabacteria bacterium]
MNIILFDSRTGHSRTLRLRAGFMAGIALTLLLATGLTGAMAGIWWSDRGIELTAAALLQRDAAAQAEEVGRARLNAEEQLTAMTVRMAELQARLLRLDALGERLVGMARLDGGEFDFSRPPPVGGPEHALDAAYERPGFLAELDRLADYIGKREQQLEVLESLLANRKLQEQADLTGHPLEHGWLSSPFGRRSDPFTGRLAMHEGVDLAGKAGADFRSVAAGVVTFAGSRKGYGKFVEVNHGGGYVTRYAHARDLDVKVGDIVKKGQTLGKIGSSGRSTGPHVHFEVRLNGKVVNPAHYLNLKQG